MPKKSRHLCVDALKKLAEGRILGDDFLEEFLRGEWFEYFRFLINVCFKGEMIVFEIVAQEGYELLH